MSAQPQVAILPAVQCDHGTSLLLDCAMCACLHYNIDDYFKRCADCDAPITFNCDFCGHALCICEEARSC